MLLRRHGACTPRSGRAAAGYLPDVPVVPRLTGVDTRRTNATVPLALMRTALPPYTATDAERQFGAWERQSASG